MCIPLYNREYIYVQHFILNLKTNSHASPKVLSTVLVNEIVIPISFSN